MPRRPSTRPSTTSPTTAAAKSGTGAGKATARVKALTEMVAAAVVPPASTSSETTRQTRVPASKRAPATKAAAPKSVAKAPAEKSAASKPRPAKTPPRPKLAEVPREAVRAAVVAPAPRAPKAKSSVKTPRAPKPPVISATPPVEAPTQAAVPAPRATVPKPKPTKKPAPPKVAAGPRGTGGRFVKRATDTPQLVDKTGRAVTVVHLSVEVAPLARTGGLGEVVTSLATAQATAGVQVAIVMPFYRAVRERVGDVEQVGDWYPLWIGGREEWCRLLRLPQSEVADALRLTARSTAPMLYFIDAPQYFDRAGIYGEDKRDYGDNMRRFAHFCAAVVQALPRITPGPVVLHAHDWHTALAPAYLRTWYAASPYHQDVAAVMTVHNAGFQGYWSAGLMQEVGLPPELFTWDRFEWHGQVNLLKGGLSFADAATTVSPNHADELRTEDGGFGLHGVFRGMRDRFMGILNGIDTARWDPATDTWIAAHYSGDTLVGKQACRAALQEALGFPKRDDVPIIVMTARMVRQKGLELILGTPGIFDTDAQWVFLGAGERRFEETLRWIASQRPDRVAYAAEFSDEREHLLIAGGDVCLMPCEYEPCGLTQMRAQRYGTLPLVRRVGGLADTVHDGVTGFVFDEFTSSAFAHAITRALATFQDRANWTRMMREGMSRDFGWARSEERYRTLYRGVLASR